MGVPPDRLRRVLFVVVALLTGTSVALAGGVGFVGLVIPHAVRMVAGSDHRRVLPLAALVGALFLLLVGRARAAGDPATRAADRGDHRARRRAGFRPAPPFPPARIRPWPVTTRGPTLRRPPSVGADPTPLSLTLSDVTVAVGSVEICSEVNLVGRVWPSCGHRRAERQRENDPVARRLPDAETRDSGSVIVGEDDLWELQPLEAARRIAVVVQEPRTDFEFTVREVVAMGRSPYQTGVRQGVLPGPPTGRRRARSGGHCGTGDSVFRHAVRGRETTGVDRALSCTGSARPDPRRAHQPSRYPLPTRGSRSRP